LLGRNGGGDGEKRNSESDSRAGAGQFVTPEDFIASSLNGFVLDRAFNPRSWRVSWTTLQNLRSIWPYSRVDASC
jgi:hypothetical protein